MAKSNSPPEHVLDVAGLLSWPTLHLCTLPSARGVDISANLCGRLHCAPLPPGFGLGAAHGKAPLRY